MISACVPLDTTRGVGLGRGRAPKWAKIAEVLIAL